MTTTETPYTVLEVNFTDDDAALSAAIELNYRRLLLLNDPDRNENRITALEQTALITKAYEFLSNEEKRRQYNKFLRKHYPDALLHQSKHARLRQLNENLKKYTAEQTRLEEVIATKVKALKNLCAARQTVDPMDWRKHEDVIDCVSREIVRFEDRSNRIRDGYFCDLDEIRKLRRADGRSSYIDTTHEMQAVRGQEMELLAAEENARAAAKVVEEAKRASDEAELMKKAPVASQYVSAEKDHSSSERKKYERTLWILHTQEAGAKVKLCMLELADARIKNDQAFVTFAWANENLLVAEKALCHKQGLMVDYLTPSLKRAGEVMDWAECKAADVVKGADELEYKLYKAKIALERAEENKARHQSKEIKRQGVKLYFEKPSKTVLDLPSSVNASPRKRKRSDVDDSENVEAAGSDNLLVSASADSSPPPGPALKKARSLNAEGVSQATGTGQAAQGETDSKCLTSDIASAPEKSGS